MQPIEGKGGMQEITHQALSCGSVVGLDRLAPEDGESGMMPAEQQIDHGGGDQLPGQEGFKESVAKQTH